MEYLLVVWMFGGWIGGKVSYKLLYFNISSNSDTATSISPTVLANIGHPHLATTVRAIDRRQITHKIVRFILSITLRP